MRLSLAFSLLFVGTACIAATTKSCATAIDDANRSMRKCFNWNQEVWTPRTGPFNPDLKLPSVKHSFTDMCASGRCTKDIVDAAVNAIAAECPDDDVLPSGDTRRGLEHFKYYTPFFEAACYVDKDNELLILKNSWLIYLMRTKFDEDWYNHFQQQMTFECTEGNKHILGTLKDFTDKNHLPLTSGLVQSVVSSAFKKCPDFGNVASAARAPYPKAQEEWRNHHKSWPEFKERLDELENAKVQEEIAKKKSNQIISDLLKKLNELEDLKKEDERKMNLEQQQNERLKNVLADLKKKLNELEDLKRKMNLEHERLKNVLDQNNSDLKNGQEMIGQLEKDLDQNASALKKAEETINQILEDSKFLLEGLTTVKQERDIALQKHEEAVGKLNDCLATKNNEIKGNEVKGRATRTSISAFSGFLSMAVLASRF